MEGSSQQERQEIEPRSPFDAVLVHGHLTSRGTPKDSDELRGSLRTRLAVRAAALLYEDGKGARKIVFLVGNLRGPNYKSTAEIMKDELVGKYGVPETDVVAMPVAYSTDDEVNKFLELSRDNNWKNVADIAFEEHYKSINKLLPPGQKNGMNISHRSVEDIIHSKDDPLVWNLVKRLKASRYEVGFKGYELLKDIAMRIPGGKRKLASIANEREMGRRNQRLHDLVYHAFDVFKS